MRVALLLTFIVSYSFARVFQIPLVHDVAEMTRTIWKGTQAAQLSGMKVRQKEEMGNFAEEKSYPQNVKTHLGVGWIGEIRIGTPPQTFNVLFDTATAEFWVPDYTCAESKNPTCELAVCDTGKACSIFCPDMTCCEENPMPRKLNPCRGKRYFNQRQSDSYVVMDKQFNRSGENAILGFIGQDTVQLGEKGPDSLVIPAATFGQVKELGVNYAWTPFDGVLGLGFSTLSKENFVSAFEQAYKREIVDPVFTLFLKQNSEGGVITFGGPDKQHCGDLLEYEKLVDGPAGWQFKMKTFVGPGIQSRNGWEIAVENNNPSIGMPDFFRRLIARETAAKHDEEEDVYYVDCNTKFTFEFGIGNHNYTVDSKNLIREVEDGECILSIYAQAKTVFGPEFILGSPFIRQFCNIFDMKKRQIGFAPSLNK
ncbi:hypothetical protein RB195_015237 [Necator americanus]|uniref:Peptidase A1 domain-containing protein n=1 Tax=Necator americanus TaxID=51031 RepID=A0ABR1E4U8_NECAM